MRISSDLKDPRERSLSFSCCFNDFSKAVAMAPLLFLPIREKYPGSPSLFLSQYMPETQHKNFSHVFKGQLGKKMSLIDILVFIFSIYICEALKLF